ncbi:tumor necrosis factor receptor superfamily member 9-like [Protopterus annectens]|uniref:TNFRSF9 n=2 Tax=Protopterus TaxID=7885 RepID=A0A6B9D8W7_PRODO|nr:tumor necrosis factor receptor superfamily member 9-like [Protopterus annectens]XP_043912393.1 tumor necrosis factor receptor superfamily member 9-like [Protopterus annectens]XP_043912394.1 tumor necrosis factor receptor superfamily member 9-like [Protopterus annectens]AKL90481.1 TNFRSF9 [Protopterus annectens]QGX42141.1 TNFRSF9 [Protopterus dolloi]
MFTMNCLAVAFLVFLLKVSLLQGASSGTGVNCHQKGGLWCCESCPPGTLRSSKECQINKNDVCKPCSPGSFSSAENTDHRCSPCTNCAGVFIFKKNCTDTSDAVCQCISGYKCADDACKKCKKSCGPGTELYKTECRLCINGTFSSEEDTPCIPWTNCSAQGKSVHFPGSSTKDVTCGYPFPSPVTTTIPKGEGITGTIVLVAAAMFLLTSILMCGMFLVTWHKKKKLSKQLKKGRPELHHLGTPKEEDECSYRFPEEEQGEMTGSQEPITKLVV